MTVQIGGAGIVWSWLEAQPGFNERIAKGRAQLASGHRVLFAEPEIIEPDQEPDDDTEAELPDVREDTVPDDPA